MNGVKIVVANPGHHMVFVGDRRVGSIYRAVRSGLREWRLSDESGRTVFTSYYFKTAKEMALAYIWRV